MADSDERKVKELFRYAMENSDEKKLSDIDPERAAWLREALASITIDRTRQLRQDIEILLATADSEYTTKEDIQELIEDILTLTEDINLANDFFKLGGIKMLLHMMANGPPFAKAGAYQIIGTLSQNNPTAQDILLKHNLMAKMVRLLPDENNFEYQKKLLFGISCLARNHTGAASAFESCYGFEMVTNLLDKLLDSRNEQNAEEVDRLFDKGAFLLFALLQELKILSPVYRDFAINLACVVTRLTKPHEYLVGSLLLLLTGNPSTEAAVQVENAQNVCDGCRKMLDQEVEKKLLDWVDKQHKSLSQQKDDTEGETLAYIAALRSLLRGNQ